MNNLKHDEYFKHSMKELQVAKDFLQRHIPKEIQENIQWDTLRHYDAHTVSADLRKKTADLVYEVNFKNEKGYFLLTLEHKSYPDKWVSFQLMNNIFRLLNAYRQQHPTAEHFPFVYGLVVYNGEKNYRYSTNFFDLFGPHAETMSKLFTEPFPLIDFSKIVDRELSGESFDSLMTFAMKYVWLKDLREVAEHLSRLLRTFGNEDFERYIKPMLFYWFENVRSMPHNKAVFDDILSSIHSKDLEDKMETLLQGLQREWREEALQEGLERGRQKSSCNFALNLLKMQYFSLEKIAELTELPLDTVKALSKKDVKEFAD